MCWVVVASTVEKAVENAVESAVTQAQAQVAMDQSAHPSSPAEQAAPARPAAVQALVQCCAPTLNVLPVPEALQEKARNLRARLVQPSDDGAPWPSPCSGICRMDMQGQFCEGCLRTLPELCQWGSADGCQRQRIWRAIVQRAGL